MDVICCFVALNNRMRWNAEFSQKVHLKKLPRVQQGSRAQREKKRASFTGIKFIRW